MTVRMAELLMGVVTLIFSVGVMMKSAELPIGWVPGRGPGSGMWPFWLATGMALASVATLIRWFRGLTPESQSEESYIPGDAIGLILITAGGLLIYLLLIEFTGTYVATAAFMFFYVRIMGKHTWTATAAFTLGTPIFIYLLFEVALTKYLPKGLPFFEDAFLVIDDLRYSLF